LGGKAYVDGRSWQSRRIRTLTKDWCTRLNLRRDSPAVMQVRAAAELQVILEMRRAELLAGEDGTRRIDVLIRLEGELRRKLRRLGLDQPPAAPPRRSLRERLLEANGEEGEP
jgi:hypothetical protein